MMIYRKKLKRAKPETSSKKENEEDINVKIVKGNAFIMDKIYNSDGLSFEDCNFMDFKDNNQIDQMVVKFLRSGVILNKNVTIYVVTGKDVNKHYDLEGNNAYPENYYISLISFNDMEFTKDIDYAAMKSSLNTRYWCDVVDNKEYKEYKKGRHKATRNIQWLIDR